MTTGKQKAARVDPNYLDRASRLKWWLTAILSVATALTIVALVLGRAWRVAASPGPLHTVHASWDNDCAVCHVAFIPTGGDNAGGVIATGRHASRASDARCQSCHTGPPHHPGREIAGEVGSCGTCHHEHRGRHVSLVDLSDNACTSCHANPTAHVVGGQTPYDAKITSFPHDHPEFRLVAAEQRRPPNGTPVDPGQLKFNHCKVPHDRGSQAQPRRCPGVETERYSRSQRTRSLPGTSSGRATGR